MFLESKEDNPRLLRPFHLSQVAIFSVLFLLSIGLPEVVAAEGKYGIAVGLPQGIAGVVEAPSDQFYALQASLGVGPGDRVLTGRGILQLRTRLRPYLFLGVVDYSDEDEAPIDPYTWFGVGLRKTGSVEWFLDLSILGDNADSPGAGFSFGALRPF